MLSVVAPQSVSGIRDGVKRVYRWRSSTKQKTLVVPPANVLKLFFRKHPDYRLEDDMLFPAEALDYKQELGDAEQVMVEALRQSPTGLLDRDSFARACLARGLNPNTFSVLTTYSCVIEHAGLDVWKLRGVKVDPAAVAALQFANQQRSGAKRVLAYGWNADGKLWVAARVPKPALASSMVIGCPGPIKRFLLAQQFIAVAKDSDLHCGTIAINDTGSSYGFGPFIRRYGLDENDVLLIEFDLGTQTAYLSIADEAILDEEALVEIETS